jgi:hypothetical protein
MRGLLAFALVWTGCVNAVAGPHTDDEAREGRAPSSSDGNGPADASANDDHAPPSEQDETPPPPVVDDDAAPPPAVDPDGDGAVAVDEPPLPASAAQSCVEWTDCGPHFAAANSGFDCVNGTCACDDTGQWAVACAGIGGYWGAEECFCYVGTSPPPSENAVLPQSVATDDTDDIVCWWRWKDLGCDPDRWVDRSYYERVCDAHGCWNEYVQDGYYEDGDCHGRWITRCSNGYEYW